MKFQSKIILNSLIENFIQYGFISNGAMYLGNERKFYIKELINLNLIKERNCNAPYVYELTDEIKNKLIKSYDLENLWGFRKDKYEYNMAKYRSTPYLCI